jgi:hypothetical protein
MQKKKYTIYFGKQKGCCHMLRITHCISENDRSGNGDWTEFLQDRVPW